MDKLIGVFKLMTFRQSHKLLLFRNTKIISESEFYNVDIIFEGVFYIDSTLTFHNPQIILAEKTDLKKVEGRCDFELYEPYQKVYEIKASGSNYFIGAGNYRIVNNNLHPDETSFHLK